MLIPYFITSAYQIRNDINTVVLKWHIAKSIIIECFNMLQFFGSTYIVNIPFQVSFAPFQLLQALMVIRNLCIYPRHIHFLAYLLLYVLCKLPILHQELCIGNNL